MKKIQPSDVAPKQEPMDLETALMYLKASYRKGMDSVKSEKDWIPADEVDGDLSITLDNRMFDSLNAEYQKGLTSAKEEMEWIPLDEVKKGRGGSK